MKAPAWIMKAHPANMPPVLALVGAIVLIDVFCKEPITSVLRRNRGEVLAASVWLAVHIMKEDT